MYQSIPRSDAFSVNRYRPFEKSIITGQSSRGGNRKGDVPRISQGGVSMDEYECLHHIARSSHWE